MDLMVLNANSPSMVPRIVIYGTVSKFLVCHIVCGIDVVKPQSATSLISSMPNVWQDLLQRGFICMWSSSSVFFPFGMDFVRHVLAGAQLLPITCAPQLVLNIPNEAEFQNPPRTCVTRVVEHFQCPC